MEGGVRLVPGNANKQKRSGSTRIRPEAYAELIRLGTEGLQTCGGGHTAAREWPYCCCEHYDVEVELGFPVDPARPLDVAIGTALWLIAEQCDYEGADREAAIIQA